MSYFAKELGISHGDSALINGREYTVDMKDSCIRLLGEGQNIV